MLPRASILTGILVVGLLGVLRAQDTTKVRDRRGKRVQMAHRYGPIGHEWGAMKFKMSDRACDYGFDIALLNTQSCASLGREVIHQYHGIIGADSGEATLKNIRADTSSWNLTFEQTYSGIPVFGTSIEIMIAKKGGRISPVTSNAYSGIQCPSSPGIDSHAASEIVKRALKDEEIGSEPKLTIYPKSAGDEIRFYLSWMVPVRSSTNPAVFVDAIGGDIVERIQVVE